MDSVDLQVLKTAAEWARQGYRSTLSTLTRTWGSAPRPVGALMLIREDGQVVGSVSGGCVEDELVNRVQSGRWKPRWRRPATGAAWRRRWRAA